MNYQFNGYDADDDSPDAQIAFLRYCHDHHFLHGLPFAGGTLIKLFTQAVGRVPAWVRHEDEIYQVPSRLIENLVHVSAVKLKRTLESDEDLANVVPLQSARVRKSRLSHSP